MTNENRDLIIDIDVEALVILLKTLKEVYNEIKKNDLEAL